MNELARLGWNDSFEAHFKNYQNQVPTVLPGRVAAEHPGRYKVYTALKEVLASVRGKLRFEATGREDFPAVGDWVALRQVPGEDSATILGVLPRQSKFSRQAPGGGTHEQIVAANVQTVLIVTALNQDYNLRRIERYLSLAWESCAQPVLVLSKSDLCAQTERRMAEVVAIAPGVPAHALSALNDEGVESLTPYLLPGRTLALLGSSGAGKSTLLNHLAGKAHQRVHAVRDGDDRGRHTTTHRELIRLPGGAMVIDTPGMRELALWDAAGGFQQTFEDVAALVDACRFRDCQHGNEPGCAVAGALAEERLAPGRLQSYLKLQRELAHQLRRQDAQSRRLEKTRWKQVSKMATEIARLKRS